MAYDGGTPPKSSIAVVTIIVNRNLACPNWIMQPDSSTEIFETLDMGAVVGSPVQAQDSDSQVPSISIHEFTVLRLAHSELSFFSILI